MFLATPFDFFFFSSEKSVLEVPITLLKYTDKWEPLDPGISTLSILHNSQDDRFRIVARASTKQVGVHYFFFFFSGVVKFRTWILVYFESMGEKRSSSNEIV